MDIRGFFDDIGDMMKKERSHYHLTLGQLLAELSDYGENILVYLDESNHSITNPHSYRGYYSDMAFESTPEKVTVKDLRKKCEAVLDTNMEGYKGGDFFMDKDTPLWVSEWGDNSGIAMISIDWNEQKNALIIHTKVIG